MLGFNNYIETDSERSLELCVKDVINYLDMQIDKVLMISLI